MLCGLLGDLARRRLEARGPELLQLMRSGPVRRTAPALRGPGVKGGGLRAVAMFCPTVCWIPLVPQGVVPAVMLLTDNVAPSWFLALHVERSQAWPIIAGMITVGLALMVTGFVLLRRAPKPT